MPFHYFQKESGYLFESVCIWVHTKFDYPLNTVAFASLLRTLKSGLFKYNSFSKPHLVQEFKLIDIDLVKKLRLIAKI
jgi:hypothetical protein